MSSQSLPMRVVRGIWRGLDRFRKILHLILMLGFLLIIVAALAPDEPVVPRSAALVLSLRGSLVDQLSGDAFERALAKVQGFEINETLLKDVIDAIRSAKDDQRIKAIVLELDGLSGAGLSKLQELAAELLLFKDSGKPVIALGSGFDQNQYYLAAHADEIYMHPMGMVLVEGYSRFIPYFKSALDKLYADLNVWTVGEYKSFVEPYTRDDMSPEDREASEVFLNALWDSYQNDVTAARELSSDSVQRYADDMVELLREAGGDTGRLAVSYGLVDDLYTRDLMRSRIRDIAGAAEDREDDFAGIGYRDYLTATRIPQIGASQNNKVAVIVAAGTILDGVQPPGSVGGDSTARLIRQMARDEQVKALVLRVDSPGGSAFASDLILKEIEVFQQSERPVIVSMGSVAASGGYWISMTADEIWASPTTITGSIGVGATMPTIQRTLDQLGVHVDGVGTTELSGQFGLTRALGDNVKEIVGETVRHIYDQFIGQVAEHRNRSVEEIDIVARGRVWIGSDAQERGLVDKLGSLGDAIESAAELAGLDEGGYGIEYVEPQLDVADRLLLELLEATAPAIAALGVEARLPQALSDLLAAATEPLAFAAGLNDPRGIYAYCFCDVR